MDTSGMDYIIIRKGKEFLVGMKFNSIDPRWSINKYDAWRTKDVGAARRIAKILDGELIVFNPINGRIKEGGYEDVSEGRCAELHEGQ